MGAQTPRPPGHVTTCLALCTFSILLLTTCTPRPHTRSDILLGSTVTITTYGRTAPALLDSLFARIAEIEALMSVTTRDYETSELLEVNRAAARSPIAVSDDTVAVVQRSLLISERSAGAFDVSIGPLSRLWDIGNARTAIPEIEDIADALLLVDYRRIEIDPVAQTIYLPVAGMALDVGAIAKGYAADEIARLLGEAGVESALLDFGGNILTLGRKPDDSAWRIGIQHPAEARGEIIAVIEQRQAGAVVTSGDYERFFERDGQRYHHILDPQTGRPARSGLRSVTILSPSSMDADALATAAFVLGPEEGFELVSRFPPAQTIFVTSAGSVIASSGLMRRLTLLDDEYRLEWRSHNR